MFTYSPVADREWEDRDRQTQEIGNDLRKKKKKKEEYVMFSPNIRS
jgi:hypothetical protein